MTTVTSHAAAKPSKPASGGGERVFNFSAGPGTLPEEVLRQVQQDVWNIGGSGIGILEHSHRGKVVDKVFAECEADLRSLANIPANYKVLFLTGGASGQNHMIPMNFMGPGKTGDYLITGYWAQKTAEQAKKFSGKPGFGTAHIAHDTKDKNHTYIPADAEIRYSEKPAFIHYCSNNTLEGTEWFRIPAPPPALAGVPLICDTSSHMYSRPLDISKYAMVYAGAQKNLGPAGVTLCIIRDDLIDAGSKEIGDLLQYRTFVPELSRPNTPPVFAVYVMGLIARWIKASGGLAAMQKHNEAKAKLIYDVLDSTKFYQPHARPDARSLMNITFRLPSSPGGGDELTDKFVKEAQAQGLDGLKGHRNVGGIRASTYNAMPRAGCEALAQFMREFERKNG
ncbi:MAG: 3-phosphoserine/phosphohydroxythreonine transaminase [Phycisphaerales bacterium]